MHRLCDRFLSKINLNTLKRLEICVVFVFHISGLRLTGSLSLHSLHPHTEDSPQEDSDSATFHRDIMGNAQARQRIKARDFDYLAKFTGFATEEVKCCIKWKVRS